MKYDGGGGMRESSGPLKSGGNTLEDLRPDFEPEVPLKIVVAVDPLHVFAHRTQGSGILQPADRVINAGIGTSLNMIL